VFAVSPFFVRISKDPAFNHPRILNDFEQTELKDIIGPIAPDPPVHWLYNITGVVGIIVCVILLVLLRRYKWKIFSRSPRWEKRVCIAKLKKMLKLYESGEGSIENADLDSWWNLLLKILRKDQLIPPENLSLDELDDLFNTSKDLSLEERTVLQELVASMDKHKYQGGGLSPEERKQVAERYRSVLKIVEQR
jgi:hypothetical protein